MSKINLFGASGHAKVIVDTIENNGFYVGYIFDDNFIIDVFLLKFKFSQKHRCFINLKFYYTIMEKIAIIGAGGFGREVKMLIDQINNHEERFEIVGFYDDDTKLPKIINGIPYLGNIENLFNINKTISLVLGVGIPKIKREIIKKLSNRNFKYPSLIHPNVYVGRDDVEIGNGCIICANTIITCNIKIVDFVTLNLSCTVGHDTFIDSYSSFMPSVNISGEVKINKKVYVGTGAKIINQLEIGENTIIGAGAVVTKNIPANCTAVGTPAKPIKFHK